MSWIYRRFMRIASIEQNTLMADQPRDYRPLGPSLSREGGTPDQVAQGTGLLIWTIAVFAIILLTIILTGAWALA